MQLLARELVKRYGELTVLDRVSIDVPDGQIVGLIGPNGSGKSTLFDVVTGIVPKDSGSVLLDGEELDSISTSGLAVKGVVRTFQVPRVARRMTVLENLMVAPLAGEGEKLWHLFSPAHWRRVRADERARLEAARQTLAQLGLESKANEFAEVLSGGQLKLLAIGIALMMKPEVLLLDEPTAGVNPRLIDRILEILAVRKTSGLATFIIEHNIAVIAETCDDVYVLDAGRVIARGTPDDVRSNPGVVAAYLGQRATAQHA
jgi:ABC-type branched-subunit amino acid transport system ATPase component